MSDHMTGFCESIFSCTSNASYDKCFDVCKYGHNNFTENICYLKKNYEQVYNMGFKILQFAIPFDYTVWADLNVRYKLEKDLPIFNDLARE